MQLCNNFTIVINAWFYIQLYLKYVNVTNGRINVFVYWWILGIISFTAAASLNVSANMTKYNHAVGKWHLFK